MKTLLVFLLMSASVVEGARSFSRNKYKLSQKHKLDNLARCPVDYDIDQSI